MGPDRRHCLHWLAAAALAACCGACVAAGRIDIISAEIAPDLPGDGGAYLTASADIELPQSIADSLRRGVTLHFLTQARLRRSRWYWMDEKVADTRRDTRLSFNPLTRTYKVFRSGLSLSFMTLEEALGQLRKTSGWRICDASALEPAESLHGEIRLRLDKEQLPKIFQMTVIRDKDWTLDSGWKPCKVSAGAAP